MGQLWNVLVLWDGIGMVMALTLAAMADTDYLKSPKLIQIVSQFILNWFDYFGLKKISACYEKYVI